MERTRQKTRAKKGFTVNLKKFLDLVYLVIAVSHRVIQCLTVLYSFKSFVITINHQQTTNNLY